MKKLHRFLAGTVLVIIALLVCFPIWFAVTGAFSSGWELKEDLSPVFGDGKEMAQWSFLPKAPTLRSLVEVLLDRPEFYTMFWNSVKVSGSILLGQLLIEVPAAWALAKLNIPGRKWFLKIYIVLMLMPFQVLMFPQYLTLDALHLLDKLWAIVLPGVFSAFPVFLLYRFFRAIPDEILEAARLDGANEFRIFWQIALPLGAPGVFSVGILSFLDSWNMIEPPMVYLKTKALWPLSLFLPDIQINDMGMGFAAALLMLIPALLVFIGCKSYLEQGIALSGGKD